MWKRINGVSDRPISRAGTKVFLKAIIHAIPMVVMSCFQLPVTTCDQMRRAIANQWWGSANGKRKIHFRSWEWLSAPKARGDLDLVTWRFSVKPCWVDSVGGRSVFLSPYTLVFLKVDNSQWSFLGCNMSPVFFLHLT
jgi:hypothetical protein